MPILAFAEAARLAGVDPSTIHRRVKRGEISASRQPNGKRGIELVELLRVYPDLAGEPGMQSGGQGGAPGHAMDDAVVHAMAGKVELLERELAAAKDREGRLLALLETEQAARLALEQRLLPGPRRSLLDRLADALGRFRGRG